MLLDIPNVRGRRPLQPLDLAQARGTHIHQILAAGGLAAYEPETLALAAALVGFFDLRRFSDVGANIGLYSLVLSRLMGPRLRTRAFEPLPSLIKIFKHLAKKNQLNIDIVESAVGDQTGEALLHVSAKSDASNSLNPNFRRAKDQLIVPVVSLDDDVANSRHVPELLKVDTESTEPDVLVGAEALLRHHRPWIICEVLKDRTEARLQLIIDQHRYLAYHLSGSMDLHATPAITGDSTHEHRDWLLAPRPLPVKFGKFYGKYLTAFRASRS